MERRAAALLQPHRGAQVRDLMGEDPDGHPQQPHALHHARWLSASWTSRTASSATTTTRPTAPACATTSMSWTSRAGMSPHSRRSSPKAGCPSTTWARARATSVLELVHRALSKAYGHRASPTRSSPRRAGDIAGVLRRLLQGGARAHGLDGTATTSEDMCEDSWRWQRMNPNGYRS